MSQMLLVSIMCSARCILSALLHQQKFAYMFLLFDHLTTRLVTCCTQRSAYLSQGLNLGALGVETDRRGFVPVDEKMQVLDSKGKPVPHLYCIGDANGVPPLICLAAGSRDYDYPACRA